MAHQVHASFSDGLSVQAGWSRRASLLALAGACLGLPACGFRLRGAMQMPFGSLRTNLDENAGVGQELVSQLRASGVRVLTPRTPVVAGQPPESAEMILDVLTDVRGRAVVGKTATGQVRELQLRHRFKFRVRSPQGREWIEATELLLERDMSFSEELVLGKEQEEQLLYRDMQQDIARQVLRRLSSIGKR